MENIPVVRTDLHANYHQLVKSFGGTAVHLGGGEGRTLDPLGPTSPAQEKS